MHLILTLTVLSIALAAWLFLVQRRMEAGDGHRVLATRGLALSMSDVTAIAPRLAALNAHHSATGPASRGPASVAMSDMSSGSAEFAPPLEGSQAQMPAAPLWSHLLRGLRPKSRRLAALTARKSHPAAGPIAGPTVQDVHDPAILAGALSVAVLAEGPVLTPSDHHGHLHALGWHLNMTLPEARDTLSLAAGMLRASGSAKGLRRRLTKRLIQLASPQALAAPICVIEDVLRSHGGGAPAQRRALRELRHALGG